MDFLRDFWMWTYILFFALFAVMAVVIIPLGLRDLIRLLAHLNKDRGNDVDPAEDRQAPDDTSPEGTLRK